MSEYTTITHRPNIDDVKKLLEEAINLESYTQLRERATQVLEQPSRSRRLGVAGDVKRFFLAEVESHGVGACDRTRCEASPVCSIGTHGTADDGEKELNPSSSALVKLWNAVSDEKTRRELLYTEFVRHVKIADAFVRGVLFPKLSELTEELFPTDNANVRREDVDELLSAKLEKYTSESFRKTRNHLLGMLGQFGMLQAHGSGFSRTWTVRHYEPTVVGWLYAIYKEFDELPERKRAESYFANESSTTRRFLLSPDVLRYVMRKALEEGHLDKEIFGGNPVYRLPYPDTNTFIKEFIDG
ncbi:MAG: hypothetical protein H8D67_29975 [Deltaproteobacteria bacterium]|nr:hypothetical protein [Deltaproteobacteria bacterium]